MQLQAMADGSHQTELAEQLQSAVQGVASAYKQPVQKMPNQTGLPDALKTGVEAMSGLSMDDVRVHRNSNKPAQLQAHAYAQGSTIHLGSGQEKHLPHEAWHVVQQKQGRVMSTTQSQGVGINNDPGLESEADRMGAKAAGGVTRTKAIYQFADNRPNSSAQRSLQAKANIDAVNISVPGTFS
jgi:hypothetical protein